MCKTEERQFYKNASLISGFTIGELMPAGFFFAFCIDIFYFEYIMVVS